MSSAIAVLYDLPVREISKPGHSRILELDGLRGLAILFVFAHHLFRKWPCALGPLRTLAEYSWIGVDLFFVLSGFLITGILLRSEPGALSLKRFYINRALRIWPLYFILLAALYLEAHLFHQTLPWTNYVLLTQNFLREPNFWFGQTWSLCIEEHFYLVWPLLVLFAPRKLLPGFLGFILLFSPLLRYYAIAHGVSANLLYTSTQYRLDPIAIGSLLALCFANEWLTRLQAAKLARWVLPFALLGSIVEIHLHPATFGQYSAVLYSLVALLSVSILALVLSPVKTAFHHALRWRPLLYTGEISYGLYMIHPFIIGVLVGLKLRPTLAIPTTLLLSFAAAAFSWHFFESRILSQKDRILKNPSRRSSAEVKLPALLTPLPTLSS